MVTAILSVAEKPSVAKELAAIIGKVPPETIRRQGNSPYNPIFRIDRCSFKDQPASMQMTSVAGHLMELEFDQAFKSWNSCSPVDLFTAPVSKTVRKDCELIQKTLTIESKKANVLLLWLDCDLEGENIAYEVIKVCLEANPRLDVYRARFSALIERDIFRTLKHPDRPNSHMNDAVDTRQEIDLRIGAAFTRFQTLRLQRRFEDIQGVVSYGPCQFPTLGFVVERDLRIKNFQAEKFWSIHCEGEFPHPDYNNNDEAQSEIIDDDDDHDNGNEDFQSTRSKNRKNAMPKQKAYKSNQKTLRIAFNWERGHVYDYFTTVMLFESLFDVVDPVTHQAQAKVIHREEKPTSKWRPVPLNTIEFQILASRFLRMSSERAMNIAESLYQRGILSYPRTETNFFKEGFELNTIIQDFQAHSLFGSYAQKLLNENQFQWPRHGNKDDQAHPPIHPTKSVELTSLENEEEKQIYELVVRHFLAACSKDAKGSQTTMKIQIPAYLPTNNSSTANHNDDAELFDPSMTGEIFRASGLMILERNYLEIYGKYDSWYGNKLPTLAVGDIFTPKVLDLHEGKTSPPSPISEAELIKAMDHNGIGTDATIATHISTIQQREYVTKDPNNCFTPTPLGLALVEGYNAMGYQLNKPYLRASIEADCQKVAKGLMSKQQAIEQCLTLMKKCFITCSREVLKLDQAMSKYFRSLGTNNQNNTFQLLQRRFSRCGQCRELMDLRIENETGGGNDKKDRRRYLFCFPCQKAAILPSKGELSPHPDHLCPICQYQVIVVKNPETQKDHTICPFCFTNPPPPPDGIDGVQEFRCFSCANSECSLSSRLAGGDINISQCVERNCSGFMRLKKNLKGFLLACSSTTCRQTWWIPKFAKGAMPQEGHHCQRCLANDQATVTKILFSFNLSIAPRGVAPQQELCPVCDPLWSMIDHPALPIKRSQRVPPNQTPRQTFPNQSSAVSSAPYPTSNIRPNSSTIVTSSSSFIQQTSFPNNSSAHSSNKRMNLGNFFDRNTISSNAIEIMDVEEDIPPPVSRFNPTTTPNPSYPSSAAPPMPPPAGAVAHPRCKCGHESKLCTVMKESENKGRTFFSCPIR